MNSTMAIAQLMQMSGTSEFRRYRIADRIFLMTIAKPI